MESTGTHRNLTRRERQIMDVVYRLGRVTAAEVQAELPDPPSYSAVRAMLRKLEEKGHLVHAEDGPRYVYLATMPREEAQASAVERLVRTFFEGSTLEAVAALLDRTEEIPEAELDRLAALVERARKVGR